MNAESKINVHHSSLVGLKAELLRKKAEVEAAKAKFQNGIPINKPKTKEKKLQEKQSKKKIEKDEAQKEPEDIEDVKAHRKSQLMLQAKSRLYEKLSKSHMNMNPHFLVDFEHKPDASDDSKEEFQKSDSENESVYENDNEYDSDDDGWVEYTDCFGRTRKCLREDLPKMQKKDEHLKKTVVEKKPKEILSKPLFFEDRVPEKEPEIEIMRRKWEEETAKLANKADIHYQDVLFDEARTHGVGYYAFSKDEEERAKQQENLTKLRKETELKQKENQEIRDVKERMQQNRLRVAKLRQRIRAGLPAEESEEEPVEPSTSDPLRIQDSEKQEMVLENENESNKSDIEQNDRQVAAKRKLEDTKNKIDAFAKALGKSNEWYVMSQEEWTIKKRKERIEEFAPNYSNFQRGESLDLQNSDVNKNEELLKSNNHENSNDSDIIGPLPPPDTELNVTEDIPLPSNDILQSTEGSKDHANVNIADQIAAGLKYLRKQFESKHK